MYTSFKQQYVIAGPGGSLLKAEGYIKWDELKKVIKYYNTSKILSKYILTYFYVLFI